jgi:hypothetical protein
MGRYVTRTGRAGNANRAAGQANNRDEGVNFIEMSCAPIYHYQELGARHRRL